MIKVHLILGFLGAGKTTFLKEVLKKPELKDERLLLMVNDYGAENYDAHELRQTGVELVAITAGCLCCSYKNQFEEVLGQCASRSDLDRILIEPSGLFMPNQVLGAFERETICTTMILEPIITMVDYQFWASKKIWPPACERLVESGQWIVRNKIDSIPNNNRKALDERMTQLSTGTLIDFEKAVQNFLHLRSDGSRVEAKAEEKIDHAVRFTQVSEGLKFDNREQLQSYLKEEHAGLIRAKGNVILDDQLMFISYVNDDLKVHSASNGAKAGLSCFYL